MRQKLSLKNENRGASLLAVLIILVVVSAIAVVITKITITNIQMKEVERGTKKNFYSAEEIMDDLHTGAAGKSAEAMKTAYEIVMQNYVSNKKAGKNLQDEFKKQYMKALEDLFWDGSTALQQTPVTYAAPSVDVTYSVSKYNRDTLKTCISDASAQACLQTDAASAEYDADYKKGTLTLKNVKIVYKDSTDYETTITTDLVFTTPEMNFTGGDQIKEFMKYSLIADNSINVGVDSVTVGGNVYAGAGGIKTSGTGDASFDGRVVLTRGDITADGGTKLSIGNGKSSVWAENIVANGQPKGTENLSETELASQDPYTLSIQGNCYVADDLSLDKAKSRVKISGNYYGYNFQEDYGVQNLSKDAQFSSAMMVNGRDSKLNLEGISYLMLAGRTFISRGSGDNAGNTNNDILMGESLAARTNQLAYYVPKEYIDAGTLCFTSDGLAKYKTDTGIADVQDYLAAQQVVAYHYVDVVSGNTTNYYLNFADENKANAFFAAYCEDKQGAKNSQYATKYLTEDAIVLDKTRIFTLKGDIMYRDKKNAVLKEQKVTIDDNKWTRTDSSMGVYFKFCSELAVRYKALELGLTESNAAAQVDDVRLRDTSNKIDKTVNPMFLTLIDKAGLEADVPAGVSSEKIVADQVLSDGAHHQAAILVNNSADTTPYQIPANYTQGIVVATGNVYVGHDFTGLIISGGNITFAANAKVDADETMVVEMFAADLKLSTPEFSQYFNDYKAGGSIAGILNGKIDAGTYLTYENWKRNN